MFDHPRPARKSRTTPSQPERSAHTPPQPAHGAAGRPIPTPARAGARSSSSAGSPDGSVLPIDVDYLVFTPVITNTCPNRRTFSAPVIALAGIITTAGIPAHRTIITIIRALPRPAA